MTGELDHISEAIGQLRALASHVVREQELARARDEKIFTKLEDIRRDQALTIQQSSNFHTRLSAAETEIEDYKKVRQWGAAIWTGSMALAAAIGYAVQLFQTWVKKA